MRVFDVHALSDRATALDKAAAAKADTNAVSFRHGPGGITSVAAGDRWLITANETDLRVWDAKTLAPLGVLEDSAGYRAVGLRTWAKDVVAAGGVKGAGGVWDIETLKKIGTFPAAERGMTLVSDDGGTLVGLGNQGWAATEIITGYHVSFPGPPGMVLGLNADGTRALLGPTKPLRIINTRTGKTALALDLNRFTGIAAITPDGSTTAATIDDEIQLHETSKGKLLKTLSPDRGAAGGPGISRLQFSRDGRRLAALCRTVVKVWDVAKGGMVATKFVDDPPDGFLWSADGKAIYVWSGSDVRILDVGD
jgi:WD40 repeat protein